MKNICKSKYKKFFENEKNLFLLNDKSQEAAKKEKSPKHTANLSADMEALGAFSVVNVRAES